MEYTLKSRDITVEVPESAYKTATSVLENMCSSSESNIEQARDVLVKLGLGSPATRIGIIIGDTPVGEDLLWLSTVKATLASKKDQYQKQLSELQNYIEECADDARNTYLANSSARRPHPVNQLLDLMKDL